MKKCLMFILLVLFSLALGICAGVAEDEMTYTCGDYKYVLLPDGTVGITDYTGSDRGLSIPTALDEHQVTSIEDYAFGYNTSLISISIPDSVTSIGSNPFTHCSHLTTFNVSPNHPTLATIDGILFEKNSKKLISYPCALSTTSYIIPAGIKIIGDSAFYLCSSLTNISIPDSVTHIGDSAFYQCSSLTSIFIPDSVTHIGDFAFSNCTSLTSISIPDSVTFIGTNPFRYCDHLTAINVSPNHPTLAIIDGILFEKNSKKLIFYPCTLNATSYTIPSGIKIIGDFAFSSLLLYSSLTSIAIPDSVTYIGDSAFYNCHHLTSISIPDSVTYIGDSAFSWCTSLTSVSISDSVTYIGDSAFYKCYHMTSISIPDSVTYIGNSAFKNCTALTSISIPDNITYIGNSAFSDCSTNLILTVGYGSYAETYCKENNLPYQLQESSPDDWLSN